MIPDSNIAPETSSTMNAIRPQRIRLLQQTKFGPRLLPIHSSRLLPPTFNSTAHVQSGSTSVQTLAVWLVHSDGDWRNMAYALLCGRTLRHCGERYRDVSLYAALDAHDATASTGLYGSLRAFVLLASLRAPRTATGFHAPDTVSPKPL